MSDFFKDVNITLDEDFEDEPINGINLPGQNDDVDDDSNVNDDSKEDSEQIIEDKVDDTTQTKQPTNTKHVISKVEHALLQQKRANRELKEKLAQIERDKSFANEYKALQNKYLSEGYDESYAKTLADSDIKTKTLEDRLDRMEYTRQAERLESKYPDIVDNLDRLIGLCKQTGWTLEKVARAELTEVSSHDVRVKTEQLAVARQQKAKSKSIDDTSSVSVSTPSVDMPDSLKGAYKLWIGNPRNKGKTSKEFMDIWNS